MIILQILRESNENSEKEKKKTQNEDENEVKKNASFQINLRNTPIMRAVKLRVQQRLVQQICTDRF